jgi:chitinase
MYPERPPQNFVLHVLAILFLITLLSCTLPPALAEETGTIQISCSPPGGDVCLDSTDNAGNCHAFDSDGVTRFYDVPTDISHTIAVFREGYQNYTATVAVTADQSTEITVVLQPAAAAATPAPAAPANPGFLQSIISAIMGLFGNSSPAIQKSPARSGVTTPSTTVQTIPAATSQKIIAAYWYLSPDPNDDTYSLVMSAQDQIPWTKINRLYIGFATVNDGILTEMPAGTSADDAARQAEMQRRIQEIVALCHVQNPGAEIFITSNFGGSDIDNEYLAAAQDPQKFADSVISYLKAHDLDGYDMDWESGQINDYAPQLTSLLSTCHTTFAAAGANPHGRPYLLTHTVWPGVESVETVAGLKDRVDQINIMSYGTGNKYDLVSYADSYAAAGFPYDKMIGGVESESGYTDNVGPDTEASVAAKCTYVKEHNLAGLFAWRIDNDMRPDNSPPTYQVTGWVYDCLAG